MLFKTLNNEPFEKDKSLYDYCEFKYPLDEFQKHALCSIKEDKNILVCAATGNGKTSVAIAAIKNCFLNNKRVIYTAPIKALLNQKYSEFKSIFKSDIGIETGDTKINPDAQCVVMTTEILRNKLMLNNQEVIQNVQCVIFDEVHYINDPYRGNVWESCIQLLQTQQVMLSATVHKPENFAEWITTVHPERDLHFIEVTQRKVPLEYYCYANDEIIQIMDNARNFSNTNYLKCKQEPVNPLFKLNKSLLLLKNKNLFPATYFVMSKKKCEHYANSVTIPLIDEETSSNAVNLYNKLLLKDKELEKQSLQVQMMRSLVSKGIGIHHAGLNPLLKEIIEELYAKNFLKLLFATGTFTVGLNMPIRTVVLTGLTVYNEIKEHMVYFSSDEFIQMCGRSGRRGLDTKGNVIICLLNEDLPSLHEAKNIMTSHPNLIESKMELNKNLIIDLISNKKNFNEIFSFVKKSLKGSEILQSIETLQKECNIFKLINFEVPSEQEKIFADYIQLQNKLKTNLRQNQYRKVMRCIDSLLLDPKFNDLIQKYNEYNNQVKCLHKKQEKLEYLKNNDIIIIQEIIDDLIAENIITSDLELTKPYGIAASCINGYDKCLIVNVLFSEWITTMSTKELAILFSYFISYHGDNLEPFELKNYGIPMYSYEVLNSMTNEKLYTNFTPFVWQWINGVKFENMENIDTYTEGNFITQMNCYYQLLENLIQVCELCELHITYKKCIELKSIIRRDIVITNSLYL